MLAQLVKQFHQLEEKIVLAIRADNEEAIYRLDQDLEKLRKKIASLRPEDPEQRKQQVEFLLGVLLTGNEQLGETAAFGDVHRLIGEYLNCQEMPRHVSRERLLSDRVDEVSGNPSELAAFLGGECSTDLFASNLRISIIGLDNVYHRTSCGNAAFYGCKPDDIAERHVGDLIGAKRFEGRARSYLEQCYQGKSLQYYHLLDHQGEAEKTTIMSCEMIPHCPSGSDVRGAVVIMRDVTLECTKPDQIELAGLN